MALRGCKYGGRAPVRWLVILAFFCGCNTCLDARNVPFEGPDASVEPDVRECAQAAEICAQRSVECGEQEVQDECGARSVSCGGCAGDYMSCGAEGNCGCEPGFELLGEGCLDIDECLAGTDDCPSGFCINEVGGFICSPCPLGQEPDSMGLCVDVDECSRGTADCDPLVSCTNLDPGFECGACPAGYVDENGDGTACADTDECIDGAAMCDTNAICTNAPGGFECVCNPGFAGDGFDCEATVLVANVSKYSLNPGGSGASTGLFGVDVAKAVPFATTRLEGVGSDVLDAAYVDVWIENNRLEAHRNAGDGTARLRISVVEFDDAVVQSGTFDLVGTSVSLPLTYEMDSSFSTFSYEVLGAPNDDRNATAVSMVMNGTDLIFERASAVGTIRGHWYVVTAENGHFTTQHRQLTVRSQIAAPDCSSIALASLNPSSSFVLSSARRSAVLAGSEPGNSHAQCALSVDALSCCRGETTDLERVVVQAQIVSFAPTTNGTVQRGIMFLGGNDTLRAPLVPPVEERYSTPTISVIGATGAAIPIDTLPEADEGGAFVSAQLISNGDEVELTRGPTNGLEVSSRWEVITWPH